MPQVETMLLEDGLREFLARFPGPARPRTEPRFLGNGGGLSGATLWRFDSELGPLVARCWPSDIDDANRLDRIHGWLRCQANLGIVPIPIRDCTGRSVITVANRLWELTPWKPGAPELHPAVRPQCVGAAFQALCRFHRNLQNDRLARIGVSPGVQRRLVELEDLRHPGFKRIEQVLEHPDANALRVNARHWLTLARKLTPALIERLRMFGSETLPLQPCLRDARRDHFLFEGQTLSGIIDFGAMDVETRVADLSRLIGDWLFEDAEGSLRDQAISAYESTGPLQVVERSLLPIYETATLVIAPWHWITWGLLSRREFQTPNAVENGLAISVARLEARMNNSDTWPG